MKRPDCIKHCEQLRTNETFSYPGDTETFGTGAALGRELDLKRLGVHYEVLAPGDRSSWPHAHKVEEEFVMVLAGRPQVWINGELFDLQEGDCVGFPAGTGDAHTFINNTNLNVKLLVVGERIVKDDKIIYPLHPARNQEMEDKGLLWEDCPKRALGGHDGHSDLKRPR
jgi:uncharacterized cupin superfamily protein